MAWAITELIRREEIDVAFDIHESSPEYPVINAIVASERSQEIASVATITLQIDGWEFSLEPSPPNFHGLSHREWTDHTNTLPILLETANPVMGRLRGRTDADLAIVGKDEQYVAAARVGAVNVPFDENGIPVERRIARNLAAISAILDAYNMTNPARPILIGGWPAPRDLMEKGLGSYLSGPKGDAGTDSLTIVITDSGLGGLSVVADAARKLQEHRGFGHVEIVFYNALFSPEGGYNSLPERKRKVKIFSRALEAFDERSDPDVMLVACNTLSVLYDDTPFAATADTPVRGIIEEGVDLIDSRLRGGQPGRVILFATETTVQEASHRDALIRRGIPATRFDCKPARNWRPTSRTASTAWRPDS